MDVILGLAAITGFLILGTTALASVRKKNYFLFFTLHVTTSISILPILYFHVSHLRLYILESAAIYVLLIIQRNVSQSKIENAVLKPLKGTSNLISITLPLSGRIHETIFYPGQHIYLSLPTPLTAPQEKLRLNPFTVANLPHQDNHIRLVLRALNGTTDTLSKLATNHTPSSSSPSSTSTDHASNNRMSLLLEGPYGAASTFPNLLRYEKVLLVAGGVGATFTVPIYRDLLTRGIDRRRIRFVWAVTRTADARWAIESLDGGSGCEIYCTGHPSRPPRRKPGPAGAEHEHDDEDDGPTARLVRAEDSGAEDPTVLRPRIALHRHRPDFRRIVHEVFAPDPTSTGDGGASPGNVAVLVCGPSGMGAALRRQVGPWVERGREIWWHSEEFGW
ncbi:MAG: hypothetical protein Q9196_001876 [Gyalolechia fulgens]